MSFLKIAVFVLAGVILLGLTRRNSPVISILCQLALIGMLVMSIMPEAEKLISLFDDFESISALSEGSLKIMIKSFGVLAAGAVVSDICRDNGEGAIAGVVELGVKVFAISCALPVFTAVVEIALTFFR